MASGCPCIVADTGGLREVVPHGERVGLRFNGGDAEHLGVMIERLLVDDGLRDRLVAEASEHVLRFDWEDIAQRTRRDLRSARQGWRHREGARRGMSELLAGLMQDDFQLTLNHIRRRMRRLQPRRRGGELTPRGRRARSATPSWPIASTGWLARSRASASSRATAWARSPGTTSATSSSTWRSPASGRSCTRSTCACSPSSSSTSSTTPRTG